MKNKIFIISGPCGAGKSTLTKKLADILDKAIRIEGDAVHEMIETAGLSWEEKLAATWDGIMALARLWYQQGYHIIIDYVVEDELSWLKSQLAGLETEWQYLVLSADPDSLKRRLEKRGDADLTDRCLFLLEKLSADPANAVHLLETSGKSADEVLREAVRLMGIEYER